MAISPLGARGPGDRDALNGLVLVDLADRRWDVDALTTWLTAAERARADGAVATVRRRRIVRRAALRQVLGLLLDQHPAEVVIGQDRGRPVLRDPRVHVSCTAHGDVALLAVSDGPVGVDVTGSQDEDLSSARAEGWLADTEARIIQALAVTERSAAVARCWAQKEAVLKGEGVGLARHPGTVVTPVAATGAAGPWWLTDISVPAGHVAALATRTPGPTGAGTIRPRRLEPFRPGGRA